MTFNANAESTCCRSHSHNPISLQAVNLESPNRLLRFSTLAVEATPQAKTIHLLELKLDTKSVRSAVVVKLFIWMTKHTKPAKKVCPKAQSFSASEACYAVLHYALPMHSCYLIHTFNTTFAFHLATKRIEENGCTLYTGSTPLLPPGVISLGACKLVSTTLLHVLPSGALGRWASMAKV